MTARACARQRFTTTGINASRPRPTSAAINRGVSSAATVPVTSPNRKPPVTVRKVAPGSDGDRYNVDDDEGNDGHHAVLVDEVVNNRAMADERLERDPFVARNPKGDECEQDYGRQWQKLPGDTPPAPARG